MTPHQIAPAAAKTAALAVRTLTGSELAARLPDWESFVRGEAVGPLSRHPGWLTVLEEGLGQRAYGLEASRGEQLTGVLGLAFVKSVWFGRFLVSLPYLNYGGPVAADEATTSALIDGAARLADELGVRYLELRHEWALDHPALGHQRTDKVHMR